MTEKNLINYAIEQIARDIQQGDYTAIEELLTYVPEEYLRGFLSETNEETIR